MSRPRTDKPKDVQAAARMRRVRSLRKDGLRRMWILVHVADLDYRYGPFEDDDERRAFAEKLLDDAIISGTRLSLYDDD